MMQLDTPTPLRSPAPVPAEASAAEPTVTEIRPPGGWQLINFGEMWHFRDLLYFLTWRDVQLRYKQTVLGAAWAILQPVLLMVVFTVFFNRFATASTELNPGIPYPLFTYAGLLPWLFFSTSIASAGNSVIGSEKLITKIYFPRLAIPFAAVGAALVDSCVAFGLLALAMLGLQIPLTWQIFLLPFVAVLIFLAAVGIGAFLAALNVNYRDIRYVIPFMVQVWMFATPSIYMDIAELNQGGLFRMLVVANPMTGLVAAFRACVLGTQMPWDLLAYAALLSVAAFVVGCFYFRRMEDGFADVI
jgi:lipopolysaccharide transport system permease protein